MLQENEGTTSTQDQPTGSDIFVSVEMSRSKWVVGIHTPRRIMVVALARKLLIALWRYATTGMVPHGAIVT